MIIGKADGSICYIENEEAKRIPPSKLRQTSSN